MTDHKTTKDQQDQHAKTLPGASPFAKAALFYAEMGFKVIPLKDRSKLPAIREWQKVASSDIEQLKKWNAKFPDANIGILCGASSGLVVLDMDPRNGGEASFDSLTDEHGNPPETPEVITGSGGRHLYFKIPPDKTVPRSKPYPGIDLQGEGSFVVAPPSIHPDTGRVYSWEESSHLAKTSLAFFPWDFANGHRTKHELPDIVPPGSRNETFFRTACKLRSVGMDEDEIFATLKALNSSRTTSGLPEGELRQIARSSCKYAPGTSTSSFVSAKTAPAESINGCAVFSPPPEPDPEKKRAENMEWQFQLLRTDKGALRKSTYNLLSILRNDPEYQGKIFHDLFSQRILFGEDTLTDQLASGIASHIEKKYDLPWTITRNFMLETLECVAHSRLVHPVKDWLNTLSWDGTPRCELLFSYFFGASNSKYVQEAGKNFLVSAVARIFSPGCDVHTMPILEGPQGSFKSRSLKALFGPDWTREAKGSPDNKDFAQNLTGVWCLEFAELNTFSRADVRALKDQISTPVDHYRPSYGRLARDFLRQCVFVGTTNEDEYLQDPTGARRFWPIKCGTIKLDEIRKERDQLFAEAVHLFRQSSPWWIMPVQTEYEQSLRYMEDSWEEVIVPWLAGKDTNDLSSLPRHETTTTEILSDCLRIDLGKHTRGEQMRVAAILKNLGWKKVHSMHKNTWVEGMHILTTL